MSMYKYIAGSYPDIKRIEVTRETDSSIWTKVNGRERRAAKVSEYSMVCDTFEEAKQWLMGKEAEKISNYEKRISECRAKIDKFSKLVDQQP